MRILAIIPARGGSKGIPRKNLAPLAGRPLVCHTLSAALNAQCLDRIIVSTDDAEIAAVCSSLDAEVMNRPAELASDTATTHNVLLHVVNALISDGYTPDAVMTLQPTSPLRTTQHIEQAATLFAADPLADSLVSCVLLPHTQHPYSVMRRTENGYLEPFIKSPKPTRRQDKEPVFARNGAAIYLTRLCKLSEYIYGGRLIPYIMPYLASIDIDSPEDLLEAERRLHAHRIGTGGPTDLCSVS